MADRGCGEWLAGVRLAFGGDAVVFHVCAVTLDERLAVAAGTAAAQLGVAEDVFGATAAA
jgi:hypothetical protein